MTAAVPEPAPRAASFADATPAQIRDALAPEDATAFEQQWRRLMTQATETFDLSEVEKALAAWRMTATVTAAHGVDTYRAMLHSSGERLRTGERAAGAVPWSQLKVELGLPG